MRLRYDDVKDDPITLRAWTGMDRVEIEHILSSFELAWEEHRRTHHRPLPARKRALGAGRKSQVAATIDKLFFILVYFKTYPLQEVMATLFGMSQSQVNEWIHRLTAVLQATLTTDLYLPARDAATLEAVLAAKVQFLSATEPGSKHDKTVAEQTDFRFPPMSERYQDSGFQGFAPIDVVIYQPIKKRRGQERTDAERDHNYLVGQLRVAGEHVLAEIKRVRIVKDRFRNTKSRFADRVMLIACGLHNLRQTIRHPVSLTHAGCLT